jgi:outer membrane protein TolC
MVELLTQVVAATGASAAAAGSFHEAGNITLADQIREQMLHERARAALFAARSREAGSREELNALLGLPVADTGWILPGRLPDIAETDPDVADLQTRVTESSLRLQGLRREIEAAGERLGLEKRQALVPDLDLLASAEKDDGNWEYGGGFELQIPIFDRGQGRKAEALAQLRRSRQQYWNEGLRLHAGARAVSVQLATARERTLHARDTWVPLATRLVDEDERQFNAMGASLFELLDAKRQQIAAGISYVESLRDYWLARAALDRLLQGGSTAGGSATAGATTAAADGSRGGNGS